MVTMTRSSFASATEQLTAYIREHGPVPAVRVSTAAARGRARNYRYWGAARYEVRLHSRTRKPTLVPQERATSDRRSPRLAELDAKEIAQKEGRLLIHFPPGPLDEVRCSEILHRLAELDRTLTV